MSLQTWLIILAAVIGQGCTQTIAAKLRHGDAGIACRVKMLPSGIYTPFMQLSVTVPILKLRRSILLSTARAQSEVCAHVQLRGPMEPQPDCQQGHLTDICTNHARSMVQAILRHNCTGMQFKGSCKRLIISHRQHCRVAARKSSWHANCVRAAPTIAAKRRVAADSFRNILLSAHT